MQVYTCHYYYNGSIEESDAAMTIADTWHDYDMHNFDTDEAIISPDIAFAGNSYLCQEARATADADYVLADMHGLVFAFSQRIAFKMPSIRQKFITRQFTTPSIP